jgi:hypothetical protein
MMNFKAVANVATSRFGRVLLQTNKHSPTILFAAGVVGFGVTVVLASRATLKVDKVLSAHEEGMSAAKSLHETGHQDYSDADYRKDMVTIHTRFLVDLTKLYAPAVVVGLASIAALTSSHVILNRRTVSLMAAYAAVERGFKNYRERVIQELGEDKDREYKHGLIEQEVLEDGDEGGVVKTIKALGEKSYSPYAVMFDERSSSWNREPGYNQVFLQSQQAYANNLLQSRGHVLLNDVYDMLGLPRTKAGCVVGWVLKDTCGQSDGYVDFGVFRHDQYMGMEFVTGNERSVLIDPNVDGVIFDKI